MKQLTCFSLLLLAACGGQTSVDIPPSSSDFPAPASDAVAFDDRLGALGDVPGGRARIGGWWLDPTNLYAWSQQDAGVPDSLELTPMSCSEDAPETAGDWTFGAEVIVAPFRLMTTEVTNRAYAICVDEGACAPPDIPTSWDWRSSDVANQPVVVTWALARSLCRHYGGDLPTAGEYARATVGDAETYAQGAILSQVLQCALSRSVGAECAKWSGNIGVLSNVGSDPDDLGPFGHADLYGNAWEWLRGSFDEQSARFCATPLDEHDISLSFPDPSSVGTTFPLNALVYSPARALGIPLTTDPLPYGTSPDIRVHDPPRQSDVPVYGFRCAFPTTP